MPAGVLSQVFANGFKCNHSFINYEIFFGLPSLEAKRGGGPKTLAACQTASPRTETHGSIFMLLNYISEVLPSPPLACGPGYTFHASPTTMATSSVYVAAQQWRQLNTVCGTVRVIKRPAPGLTNRLLATSFRM
eukprot:1659744-Pyramimonas_sp.AAC.1